MNARVWRYLRRLIQLLLLVLFLYLFVSTRREGGAPAPVNLFARSDPLLALSSMVAARQVILTFVPAVIIVLLTLALGRFWCGWICPLGTVLDLFGPQGRRGIPQRLRQAKYFILFIVLFAALFANLTLLFLDPITIFVRALSGVVSPGLQQAGITYPEIQPFVERIAPLPLIKHSTPVFEEFQPIILPVLALPFVAVLVLNLVVRRFWCRYLCPLGALVGLLSRFAWIKRRVEKGVGLPSCRLSCPAGTNVTGYVALISRGKFKEAVDLIRENNPFPTVCGHVCPRFCEDGCNRREFDAPLAIGMLERFAADYMLKRKDRTKPVPITEKEKVAIIGSGPAGLSAAFHLRKMGYYVKVFEKLPEPGGMLVSGIPEYRLPPEVLQKDIEHIKGIGVEIETNAEVDKQRFEEIRKEYQALFISVGSHQSRKLGVEGEDLQGVVHGVDFLRDVNFGEEVKVGNKVAVIGGGDVAIDAARCALRLGSEDVTIVYRRSREEMPARAEEVKEAEEEGIKITYLAAPTRIIEKNGNVGEMECIRMELGEPDESGRPRPIPIEGSEFLIDVDMVMPAIGQSSDLAFLESSGVETPRGWITTDDHCMTTQPGLFAGGDVVTGPDTVAWAIGRGKKAAISISRYLQGEPFPETVEEKRILFEDIPKEKLPRKKGERIRTSELPVEERKKSFDEVRIGLSRKEAIAEAQKCLNWSCGQCTSCLGECPMGCIDEEDFTSDPAECLQCLNCYDICPAGAVSFGGELGLSWGYDYDFSRRELLASLAAGVVWTGLLKTGLAKKKSPHLLRPPGATEDQFLTECVRCGRCIKVCPNSALQMSLFEGGWEGFWTPMLVARHGYCDYECNACGQVCPSEAIPPLPLEEKRKAVIGTAHVDFDQCIRCLKCIPECPKEALEEERVEGRKGVFPMVVAERCIGCGICEYICPVEGESAIIVYAPGALPG